MGIPAQIILLDGRIPCTIDNLSLQGACIALETELEVGQQGFLAYDRLDTFFSVSWAGEGRYGLTFDRALPIDILRLMKVIADDFSMNRDAQLRQFGQEWVDGERTLGTDG